MSLRKVIVEAPGGPEAMKLVEAQAGEPGPGEIRIRHRAVGLNFIDVYHRSGVYPLPMPLNLGMEAAGVVEAVGAGVTHLAPGDRAAYAANPPGSYCDARVMPAAQVARLPDGVDFETGAAMMLKGLTVQYLFRSTAKLKQGDTVLFHAAAGGVGLIACQWARAMGLRLIATAGTDEKCRLALDHGAAEAINYRDGDWPAKVRALTGGMGVPVVMDSVGAATWAGSLDCLQPFGLMITFGNASGKVPPVDVGTLAAKGSLYLTRPTLFTHLADHDRAMAMAADLFDMVLSGKVTIPVAQRFPLEQVADAHRALEARATTGATVLTLGD
ncbi:MAG: quinone oxidoreductase family protein [Rubrimonas sp.]